MTHHEYPDIKTFHADTPGPSLLFLGAIHGNEVCGSYAIKKFIKEIELEHITIKKGTVTFVPVCNPKAHRKKKRFIEDNLNRVFKKWSSPNSYEKNVANYLTKLVQSCDVLLDIHSVSAKSVPLVFIDFPTKDNISFAKILGAPYGLKGWPQVYKHRSGKIKPYDTASYAKKMSKKCLVIECGKHNDPKSKKFAYSAILNTLRYFSAIDGNANPQKMTEIKIKKLFIKDSKGDTFYKNWKNFDKFKKGDILAKTKSEGKIIAPFDGVMIMPKNDAEVNTEWFYIGVTK